LIYNLIKTPPTLFFIGRKLRPPGTIGTILSNWSHWQRLWWTFYWWW